MMVMTEEFSFPIITATGNNNVVHLTVLPPLWTTSCRSSYLSSAEHDRCCNKRSKFFTRSFSQVESQVLFMRAAEQAEAEEEEAEEKMDMLWEDFNNNEHHHHRYLHKTAAATVPDASSNSSSPANCSSPLEVEVEVEMEMEMDSSSSSDPPQITKPQKTEFEAGEGGGSFRHDLEARTSGGGTSNLTLMMIPANKKKKRKLILLQESVVKTMKKLFQLKNISTFKKKH